MTSPAAEISLMNPIYQNINRQSQGVSCNICSSHVVTHPSSDTRVSSVGRKPLGPRSLEVASAPVALVAPLASELAQHAGQPEPEHQQGGHQG